MNTETSSVRPNPVPEKQQLSSSVRYSESQIDAPVTPQALRIAPTRELVIQIMSKCIKPMAAHMAPGLSVGPAFAGEQIARGSKVEAHLIVGTPGKFVYWLKRRMK